ATCVGWGPIGDAGYLTRNQAVKDSLASRLGAAPLAVETALAMLGEVLAAGSPNLALADFHWPTLARLLPSSHSPRFAALWRNGDEAASGPENLEDFRSLIEGKSPDEVRQLVRSLVTQEVAQTLAINPERIDAGRSLHDLGLDSLMGVELALGLEKRFGVQVPAMMLNEGPTVDRVTERIVERLGGGGEVNDLASTAAGMAAQHAQDIAPEILESVVNDLQGKA
ncbi:MAG TPA: beta-ketoacyl reductase, partial [Azonexus sp.]|nr:beta-ketoacyl reductase [Azonexus sp.]